MPHNNEARKNLSQPVVKVNNDTYQMHSQFVKLFVVSTSETFLDKWMYT